MRAAADWVAARLPGGRVVESDGHPVVLGELEGLPGAPAILVYGHYDVQPPGDLAEWTAPPFAPDVRDGRLYGRGASDDKGPCSWHWRPRGRSRPRRRSRSAS